MTSPYRWVILAVSTLGFMQSHLHRVGFAPLIPIFIRDLRISYAAAGTIMTSSTSLALCGKTTTPVISIVAASGNIRPAAGRKVPSSSGEAK